MNEQNLYEIWLLDKNNTSLTIHLLDLLLAQSNQSISDIVLSNLTQEHLSEPSILVKVVELHIKLEKFTQSNALANQLVLLTKQHPLGIHYQILTLFLIGKYSNVIVIANEYELLKESQLFVARSLYLLGDINAGVEVIEKQNLTDNEALGVLSIMKLDLALYQEAQSFSDQVLSQDNDQFEALLTRTTLNCMAFDFNLAAFNVEKLLKKQPFNGRVLSLKGQIHLYKTELKEAITVLEIATENMANHIGTWHLLAWAYFLENSFVKAQYCFEQSLTLDRNFPETHGGLACTYLSLDEASKAKKAMALALKLNKESFSGQYAQALLLQKQGKNEEANSLIDLILSGDSGQNNHSFAALIKNSIKQRN